MDSFTEVIVVGAGPTGLMLAGDLARAGVGCTVLERRAEESNLTRAFAVHAQTLEMLDARGLADDLVATGARVGALRLFGKLEVDLSRLPTRFPYVLVTPQYNTERVPEERASALGMQIVRGAEVVDLRQDNDGVELEVRHEDGTLGTRRATYAIGADGVHSKVRQALALPFPGHSAIQSVMLADVRLSEAPEDVLTVNAARDGFIFIAPFGDGWYRVIAWDRRRELPDDAPVELEEIREITWRVLGTDYGMHDPRWMSRFHSDERQVPHYRVGRVFLAGDAAHCHSPAGGQGMNTGLQDAANLGWKLAAAVQGWAPDGLLDSYQTERYPVGRAVVRGSGALLRLTLAQSQATRAVRWLLANVVGRFASPPAAVGRAVSGVGIAYPAPRGEHRLAGRRAPDIRLASGEAGETRLYEILRGGRFVLLTPAGAGAAIGRRWTGRVDLATPADVTLPMALVRPDGYVAWSTDEIAPASRDAALRKALAHWCGQPIDLPNGTDRSAFDITGGNRVQLRRAHE
jgi:2-polyprenyl-6-methoxyphenol hydroxylase-like FAD-dependent oxidoreductase